MKASLIDQIAEAVLYEGYILYPYRPSSKKNQHRFTFGRVYPEAFSITEKGAEPCVMQAECLARVAEGASDGVVEVCVRFLHQMTREIGVLRAPMAELPASREPVLRIVPELRVDGKLFQTWQQATEREIVAKPVSMRIRERRDFPFSFPPSRVTEPIRNVDKKIAAFIVLRQETLEGAIEIATEALDSRIVKITARVKNLTPIPVGDLRTHDQVLARSFLSTHLILRASGGEFLSLTDPPQDDAKAASSCQNIGVWPVLVGNEQARECNTMLASPIILCDYPQLAPESPGDFCDGTEIDEMLALRIKTMTDQEKSEMRGVDDFARRILERTEGLPDPQLLQMHGVMRGVETSGLGRDFFNPNTRLTAVPVRGVFVKAGDRVRIQPKGRADAMDMILKDKTAVVEAVEQDAEGRVHFALVLEEDPGRDLGMMRQPGHRFFYTADELEPLGTG
jgi:hypothetical protein